MRSSMKREYAAVPRMGSGPRSTFNVSEAHKTTFNASYLIPIYWDFLYPGEVRKSTTRAFVRMSNPLQYPLMDNLWLTVHWFEVSLRILWDNFRKFYGERIDPSDSIDYTLPVLGTGNVDLTTGGVNEFRDLCDYLGLPHVASFDMSDATSLPFRAYNAIYNYMYRDQNLQDSVAEPTDDGPDGGSADFVLLQRGKMHDYFTSLLPQPQKGESVTIGGEIATAAGVGGDIGVYSDAASGYRQLEDGGTEVEVKNSATNAETNKLYPNTTIHELRNAVAIQQFLEKDNRGGTRFGEQIYCHWGTEFQDARYAPVFVGGGRAPIITTPIYNNAANTTESADLGDFGAIGTGAFEGASFTYAAQEPSILMGIACVDADLTYHQGLNRKWSYRTRYDFVWPEFEGIGDQAVLTKEIYYQNNATDDVVFGYGPRYEEARTGINRLSGEFRPDNLSPIDEFHVAQDFVGAPTLNTTFIKASVPMGRVLQSNTPNHFYADFHVEMYSTKQLSLSGIPGLARL